MQITNHAQKRAQERRISSAQLEWLMSYGKEAHNRGVSYLYFDSESFRQLVTDVDDADFCLACRSRKLYLVVNGSTVITAGLRGDKLKTRKANKRFSQRRASGHQGTPQRRSRIH